MKILEIITLALLLAVPGMAYDQRDGSNGVPFLPPDPSLKTTDAFMANLGAQYAAPVTVDSGYQLPPIFGGSLPLENSTDAWMDLSEHDRKLYAGPKSITAASSYDLTEAQLAKGNVTLGAESWL